MTIGNIDPTRPFPGSEFRVSPLVRRITCPNPGKMTGPGTNTYLIGEREVTVVDPGPDPFPAHIDKLVIAAGGSANISKIVCTHTHLDHSPGVARLKRIAPHAEVMAFEARDGLVIDTPIADAAVIATGEYVLRAVHTPGHASNHLCFWLDGDDLLFSGDHVMEGSTVVISPPDGHMATYLESLEKVIALHPASIAPAHGSVIRDPVPYIAEYLHHRREREVQVLQCVATGRANTVDSIVAVLYAAVRKELHPVAARSVEAHLIKLIDDGRVERDGDRFRATER